MMIDRNLEDIVNKIKILEIEAKALKQELLEASPIKYGDKVKYKGKVKYVMRVELSLYRKYGLRFELTDKKKNGNMPSRLINGVYYCELSDLEKI